MGAGNLGVYDVIVTTLSYAFSFWMVADSFRRRASFWWVIVILFVKPPFGALAYLAYVKLSERSGRAFPGAGRPSTVVPPSSANDDPSSATLDIADRLEEQRRFGEAAMIYRRALETRPQDPRAMHGLSRCQVEFEQLDEAVETYEALMAIDPRYRDYTAALEYAEVLQRVGRGTDATGLLEGMVLETGRLNHRLALAHYCEQSGQTARARSVLSEALAAYERSPAPEQVANRRWQRRIVSKLEELAAS
jgi:hypothetical protein